MNYRLIRQLHRFRRTSARVLACVLAAAAACGSTSLPVSASAVGWETISPEDAAAAVADSADAEEEEAYVLLASAGFSYAFSAKKVSLRDVEDNMYDAGIITAKRTSSENTLTLSVSAAETTETGDEEDDETQTSVYDEETLTDAEEEAADEEEADRVIADTSLTPVQKKEQSVVNAVSETQNITVDTSTATILSATAVSVVSDTGTAVTLQEMVDKKQTQAKLDQGVISAVEAEALMAVYESTADGSVVVDGTGPSSASSGTQDSGSESSTSDTSDSTSEQTVDQVTAVATDADGNEIVVAQVNDYINIREDASSEAEIVGYLYDGSVATVLGRTGNGWVRIESGGIYGYIREEYVATGSTAAALAEEVATQQAVVTTETLRVRAAPQADSDVISLIGEGETLDILEVVDGWYKVNTVDGEGYISADFADVEQRYPTAVSVEDMEEETEDTSDTSSSTGTTGSASSSSSSSSSSGSSYSSLNSYTGGSGSGSSSGQAVANYALQFVGNPYVWGGTSLTNGADCSGFTMAVYANFGVSLPHSSYSQESCGTAVASLDEAQPGDLLIYDGHVAIYLGNNQIVHASNPANGICVGTATYRTIIAIRRIFS